MAMEQLGACELNVWATRELMLKLLTWNIYYYLLVSRNV